MRSSVDPGSDAFGPSTLGGVSLVVFPFKNEEIEVVTRNLRIAAANLHVDEVWAIAATDGQLTDVVRQRATEIASAESKPVRVIEQERIGTYRSGKGDGMNTALRRAAALGRERVHFYDADITNFDDDWIDGAEAAADRGYGVVRHRFPRAATDAMITWMVTRPGLAMAFPGTILPRLDQPLGGELLLGAEAIQALASSALVSARSDWGIDTVITYLCSTLEVGLYEHLVVDGKRHALYGSLYELRDMVLECLDAVAVVGRLAGPNPSARHSADLPAVVPEDLTKVSGYDVSATLALFSTPWSRDETEWVQRLDPALSVSLRDASESGRAPDVDAAGWGRLLQSLLSTFQLGDPGLEDAAFRLWLGRVLSYTTGVATNGYEGAMAYLRATIEDYERRAMSSRSR
jgi:mannosylglycerate synthase